MPSPRLSLFWGPSFAESKLNHEWTRIYTAQTPVPQFLKSLAPHGPFEVQVSLSVMRKILHTRLGNSVAQLVTKGFEQWVLLRQEAEPGHFDLAPSRREPLTNPENLFGVQERISSAGQVLQALDLNDLEKVATEMKKRGVERVCVNFLFSHRNPVHQEQATRFLQEKGFRVFSRHRPPDSADELSSWRRNLLDASLSSFFEKLRSEIEDSLPGSSFLYLDTEKGPVPFDQADTTALLFGRERALQGKKPLLYFGPEEWAWILPEDQKTWKSPWGSLELSLPRSGFFSLQPGRELQLTGQARLKWGEDSGMDPGPMLWGRSKKITLLDLMDWHWPTTPPLRRDEKTQNKTREQIDALKRNSRDWAKLSDEKIKSEVMNHLLESIFSDLGFAVDAEEFEVGGVLGETFLPLLSQARPKWKWTLRSEGGLK